jgi:hypothetical protein
MAMLEENIARYRANSPLDDDEEGIVAKLVAEW